MRACTRLAPLLLLLLAAQATPAPGENTTLVYPPFGHCLGLHKITDFHRFIYLGMRTELDDPTGIAAVKLRSEDDPSTEGDDDELTVFGLNTGRCEILYNASLYEARLYGACGSGAGQFSRPLDIAADELGNVFVADTGNDRIVRLRYESGDLKWIRAFRAPGAGRAFRSPSGVALGESGTLYVADTGNDRIVVMSPAGDALLEIAGGGAPGSALEGPTGIAVVEPGELWIASRRDDVLLVTDRGGTRLSKFRTDGTLVAQAEAGTLPVTDARFGYVDVDFYGSVYVTDGGKGCIHKLDWKLDYVSSFGRQGEGDGEFDRPRGITLWRRFGQIFVTERTGAQYLWIGTEIRDATVTPAALVPGEVRPWLSYYLTETSRVTIELVDERGRVSRTLVDNRRRALGPNRERLNVRVEPAPQSAEPLSYTLRITATPTYSSGVYFHDTAEIALELLGTPHE